MDHSACVAQYNIIWANFSACYFRWRLLLATVKMNIPLQQLLLFRGNDATTVSLKSYRPVAYSSITSLVAQHRLSRVKGQSHWVVSNFSFTRDLEKKARPGLPKPINNSTESIILSHPSLPNCLFQEVMMIEIVVMMMLCYYC